jgi:hypothetical protein
MCAVDRLCFYPLAEADSSRLKPVRNDNTPAGGDERLKLFLFTLAEDLEFAQEIHDLGLAPVHGPDELAAQHPVAVDDVGFRELERAVKGVALLVSVSHREQVHFVVGKKPAVGAFVRVHADGQHFHPFGLHLLLHLHQRRHLIYARWTPRGPEIQDHNLAPQLVQADLAIGILNGEVRSGIANMWRPAATVASGPKRYRGNQQEPNCGRGASHKAIITNSGYGGGKLSLGAASGFGHRSGAQ